MIVGLTKAFWQYLVCMLLPSPDRRLARQHLGCLSLVSFSVNQEIIKGEVTSPWVTSVTLNFDHVSKSPWKFQDAPMPRVPPPDILSQSLWGGAWLSACFKWPFGDDSWAQHNGLDVLYRQQEGSLNQSNLVNIMVFPSGSDGKEAACNAGDWGSIPRSRRSPGEGHGNPLQYSCLENPMDRGA